MSPPAQVTSAPPHRLSESNEAPATVTSHELPGRTRHDVGIPHRARADPQHPGHPEQLRARRMGAGHGYDRHHRRAARRLVQTAEAVTSPSTRLDELGIALPAV